MVMMVVTIPAIVLAIHHGFMQTFHDSHNIFKLSVMLMLTGLVVQCFRSIHYLKLGYYPIDVFFPTWITKDLGICLFIYGMIFLRKK